MPCIADSSLSCPTRRAGSTCDRLWTEVTLMSAWAKRATTDSPPASPLVMFLYLRPALDLLRRLARVSIHWPCSPFLPPFLSLFGLLVIPTLSTPSDLLCRSDPNSKLLRTPLGRKQQTEEHHRDRDSNILKSKASVWSQTLPLEHERLKS